jgi:hypothetical protein
MARPLVASRATTLSADETYMTPSTTMGVEPMPRVWYSHRTASERTFVDVICRSDECREFRRSR